MKKLIIYTGLIMLFSFITAMVILKLGGHISVTDATKTPHTVTFDKTNFFHQTK